VFVEDSIEFGAFQVKTIEGSVLEILAVDSLAALAWNQVAQESLVCRGSCTHADGYAPSTLHCLLGLFQLPRNIILERKNFEEMSQQHNDAMAGCACVCWYFNTFCACVCVSTLIRFVLVEAVPLYQCRDTSDIYLRNSDRPARDAVVA
jgi:hypothetical protein